MSKEYLSNFLFQHTKLVQRFLFFLLPFLMAPKIPTLFSEKVNGLRVQRYQVRGYFKMIWSNVVILFHCRNQSYRKTICRFEQNSLGQWLCRWTCNPQVPSPRPTATASRLHKSLLVWISIMPGQMQTKNFFLTIILRIIFITFSYPLKLSHSTTMR